MKYILILLVTISFAYGQTTIDITADKPTEGITWEVFGISTPISVGEIIIVKDIFDYAEECYADTIRLEKFGDEEYLLMHEHYGEIFTERQLEERGYYYSYRWITNTAIDEDNPMEFEYIFIGKPTLEGFIEWFKKKL